MLLISYFYIIKILFFLIFKILIVVFFLNIYNFRFRYSNYDIGDVVHFLDRHESCRETTIAEEDGRVTSRSR